MLSPESLQAFVLAAELGSFSAAARRLNKAQSAVSTAIANLEIDIGFQLFDRSTRSPTLTQEGRAMLPHAHGVLFGAREFMAKAGSMAKGTEDRLSFVVERSIELPPVYSILERFAEKFPTVGLETLSTGPNDTGALLKEGRADLGLMIERESYPVGFQFRGVGHTKRVRACSVTHPLAGVTRPTYVDLRQHRQIVLRSRYRDPIAVNDKIKNASIWHAENPSLIVEFVLRGLGWAELPLPSVASHIANGTLLQMDCAFQQSDELFGIDVVWTERRALGPAGQWLRDQLLAVPQEGWFGSTVDKS